MGTDKVFLFLIPSLKSNPISPQAFQVLWNIRECRMSATDQDFTEANASARLMLKGSGKRLFIFKYTKIFGIMILHTW